VLGGTALLACTHALQVKNFGAYLTPVSFPKVERKVKLGVRPFAGASDDLFFFNTVVQSLRNYPGVARLTTDVRARDASQDLIVEVKPSARYRSSIVNLLINFPGYLIFTPAWNGYVYRAEIVTEIKVTDGNGALLQQVLVPVSYNLRHADFDRTILTGLTWAEAGMLALGGGIYNAAVFDRDAIAPLHAAVRDNYGQYVMTQLNPRLKEEVAKIGSRSGAAAVEPVDGATPVNAAPAP
jgi:hypothetical protein